MGFTTRSHSAESIELMNMKIIFNGFNLHAETIFYPSLYILLSVGVTDTYCQAKRRRREETPSCTTA